MPDTKSNEQITIQMSTAVFLEMFSALKVIANYEEQPIWADSRDDAANDMIRIAQETLTHPGMKELTGE